MTRLPRSAWLALLPFAFLVLATAAAQVAHTVPRGEISGVDLQIEGQLVAYRGHRARLAFTAFEVLGLDRLRRAPRTVIDVHTSFSREAAVATVTTDTEGRALAEFAVPEDVEGGFRMVVEARTPSRVQRRFELEVQVVDPRLLDLHVATATVLPGSPVLVAGRLIDRATSRPLGAARFELVVSGPRGPVGSSVRVATDAHGIFDARFLLEPDAPYGHYTVQAVGLGERPLSASSGFDVGARRGTPLLVSLATDQAIVAPRTEIALDVLVRRPDGRPVEGATVTTVAPTNEVVVARTDARGRATVRRRVTPLASGVVDDVLQVQVEKAGLGAVSAGLTVRVAASRYVARLSFEGGRFAQSLGGTIYVRAVGADGRPAPRVPVALTGPRVRGEQVTGTTDEFGVAAIPLALLPPSDELAEQDSCGGTVATQIEATVGEGSGAGRVSRCLPVDVDGVLRVRTRDAYVRAGAPFEVTVDRANSLGRVPIVVDAVVLEEGESRGAVVARATVAPNGSTATLALPADATGRLLIVARPLMGTELAETRGAATVVVAGASTPFEVEARFDRERSVLDVRTVGSGAEPVAIRAYAQPYEELAPRFVGYDADSQIARSRTANADAAAVGDSYRRALLADAVPADALAAHAVVDGDLVALPAPAEPESMGRLRDPYRARARFVEGRLALLFRALEAFVAEHVPGSVEEVAHLERGRFTLNDAVLSAVAAGGDLGGEGATGLGGAPITIAQLRALDPSFDYDAIARRVTRERLFKLLLGLRGYVADHGFDLAWARPGDPRVWVQQMVETGGSGEISLDTRSMVDGWGRPFQLVPTQRPRFAMLQPVFGFELVSAGPDGRYGNGDDVFDPTARALAAGSLYARSVQEDALVARLRGVELSRATLGALGDLFGLYVETTSFDSGGAALVPDDPSPALPTVVEIDPDPLAIRRVGRVTPGIALGPVDAPTGQASLPLDLGVEPRTWGIVVAATTASGGTAVTFVRATTGSSALLHGELPVRLHAGEPTTTDIGLTSLDSADRTLQLQATSCDGLSVEVPAQLAVPAGLNVELPLSFRARSPGRCPVHIEARDGGRVLATLDRDIEITTGRHPERRRATALVGASSTSLDLAVPDDAHAVSARVSVVDAASIMELPELNALRRERTELLAWARVATGRGLDDSLRDDLLRAYEDPSRPRTRIGIAAAVIALANRPDDPRAAALLAQLRNQLDSGAAVIARDDRSADVRTRSAVVAALALSGVPDPDAPDNDGIANVLSGSLPALRAVVRQEVTDGAEQAFAAAAVLLADARDAHGRALFDRALAASKRRGERRYFESASGREPVQALAAAAAMAVAAGELGREADARAFALTALTQVAALARGGEDGVFWLAAMSVYGTLSGDERPQVDVSIGHRTTTHTLETGRVVVPVELTAGGRASIAVRVVHGRFAVAEAEVAYERPFQASNEGPLTVAISGDVGQAYGTAALEVSVTATEYVFDPVVELELPPGVEANPTLTQAILRTGTVLSVEPRAGGFLRLRLQAFGPNTVTFPLPITFTARGSFSGLAASAYPAAQSYRRSVLPPRAFDFGEP